MGAHISQQDCGGISRTPASRAMLWGPSSNAYMPNSAHIQPCGGTAVTQAILDQRLITHNDAHWFELKRIKLPEDGYFPLKSFWLLVGYHSVRLLRSADLFQHYPSILQCLFYFSEHTLAGSFSLLSLSSLSFWLLDGFNIKDQRWLGSVGAHSSEIIVGSEDRS